jgi:DNA polymerase III delta prime subunit
MILTGDKIVKEVSTRYSRQLLSQLMCPTKTDELILSKDIVDRFQIMISSKSYANMMFSGPTGAGKTSAARIFVDSAPDSLAIKDTDKNQHGDVLDMATGFASTHGWEPGLKLCCIEGADFLSKPTQTALGTVMDDYCHNCRFILTVSDSKKLVEPLRSRLKEISFDSLPADRDVAIEKLMARYEKKLPELGVNYDPERLRGLIGEYWPDLRAIANRAQFEFA